jgi:16S rRNA (uracil1498-N3)-methyltransferase
MDDVIRDAVMMGVEAVVPLVTAHTVAHKAAAPHGPDRWRRVAVASAKQCRTARVPDVHAAVPFVTWLGRAGAETRLLLVEPSVGNVAPLRVRDLDARGMPRAVTLTVGPEGGWAAAEVEAAVAAGFVPVTLGPLTLRAEAVPLAALAALSVVWD